MIIGAGDLGERFAAGLAAAGVVRRLVLVSRTGAAEAAAMVASAHDVLRAISGVVGMPARSGPAPAS